MTGRPITIWISGEELGELDLNAASIGVSRSDFVRRALETMSAVVVRQSRSTPFAARTAELKGGAQSGEA